jgi:putative membrane protein
MRKLGSVMMIALMALAFQSCRNSGKKDKIATDTFMNDVKVNDTASATTTIASTGLKPEDKEHDVHPVELKPVVSAKDVRFASIATNDGLNAVNNSKMAQEKTINARVRNFAIMLVNDHTKFGNDLTTIAKDKKITLPALPGMAEMQQANRLAMKQGTDFDRAYVDAMIAAQKKAIALYENGAKDCKDPDLKSFAAKTLPVLKMHLDSAQAVRSSIQ